MAKKQATLNKPTISALFAKSMQVGGREGGMIGKVVVAVQLMDGALSS